MTTGASQVVATIPGTQRAETGKVAMVENAVDAATGMITVRGVMDNASETLWPGTLVSTRLIVRSERAVVVPSVAIQRSQTGSFVFVIRDNVARVQPVTVLRTSQGLSVVETGLAGGEQVVVDGQLLLLDGTRVEVRPRRAGA
jgi:RND family efflux transporter MFP subunit